MSHYRNQLTAANWRLTVPDPKRTPSPTRPISPNQPSQGGYARWYTELLLCISIPCCRVICLRIIIRIGRTRLWYLSRTVRMSRWWQNRGLWNIFWGCLWWSWVVDETYEQLEMIKAAHFQCCYFILDGNLRNDKNPPSRPGPGQVVKQLELWEMSEP